MSVILVDLGDDTHDLQINWWNWRPILSILRDGGLVGEEQFDRMGANGCGGQMPAEQAANATAFLTQHVLPRLAAHERMHANGEVSVTLDGPRPMTSLSAHELYAAQRAVIERFVAFCGSSRGFEVL